MSEESRKQFLANYAVDQLVRYLIEERQMSMEDALDSVYTSRTFNLLQDSTVDLTSDSPSYIYELLKKELDRH